MVRISAALARASRLVATMDPDAADGFDIDVPVPADNVLLHTVEQALRAPAIFPPALHARRHDQPHLIVPALRIAHFLDIPAATSTLAAQLYLELAVIVHDDHDPFARVRLHVRDTAQRLQTSAAWVAHMMKLYHCLY